MKNLHFVVFNISGATHGTYEESNPQVLNAIDRVMLRRNMTSRELINSDFYKVHENINNCFRTLADSQNGK